MMRSIILLRKPFRPSPFGGRGATAIAVAALSLSACVTAPVPEAPSQTENAKINAGSVIVTATGPEAGQFLGRPVALLDDALGPPSLIRAEGKAEFRRYDLGDCRAYAMVADNGTVSALSTGPARIGAPAQPFEQCSAQTAH